MPFPNTGSDTELKAVNQILASVGQAPVTTLTTEETLVINEELNTSTRGPDPTADSLSDLISASAEKDIGFAFDLDGDRLVVVRKGKKQTPDVTLGLGVVKSLELGYKNLF